jgi:hypothetical protein
MNAVEIEKLLVALKCQKIKVRTKWVGSSCPMAVYRHSKGVDNTPSFGISIAPGGVSHCKCFACGFRGTPQELLYRLKLVYGWDVEELVSFVQQTNPVNVEDELEVLIKKVENISFGPAVKPKRDIQVGLNLKDDVLQRFQDIPPLVSTYLKEKRGLSEKTILEWELGWQSYAKRIVIPIRDRDFNLVGISGRAFDAGQHPKFLHSKGFRRDFYLYGEHKIEEGKTGIIVEGFFDAMRLWQLGYNVVAIMGTYFSSEQVKKIKCFFSDVVVLFDGDVAGRKASKEALEVFRRVLPVRVGDLSDGVDPGDLDSRVLSEIILKSNGGFVLTNLNSLLYAR